MHGLSRFHRNLPFSLLLFSACAVDPPSSALVQGDWELTSLNCDGMPDTSLFDEGALTFDGESASLSLTSAGCTTRLSFNTLFQTESRVRFGGTGDVECDPEGCDADACGASFSENWGFTLTYDEVTDPDIPTLTLEGLETDRGPALTCSSQGLGTTGGYSFRRPE